MQEYTALRDKIFSSGENVVSELAFNVFEFQYQYNLVYRQFVDLLKPNLKVKSVLDIPFMPVEIFKHQRVLCEAMPALDYFESSGTTGSQNSRHYVADFDIYEKSYERAFRKQYGNPEDWVILGLLPSYLEREHASLVYMVKGLMALSAQPENGFFLYNYPELDAVLQQLHKQKKKVLLFGVTFALLDFARKFPGNYPNLCVIETGGMKGRGKELTREELHETLSNAFQTQQIHSEYGMTEMFSQAYSTNDGLFFPSDTMAVLKRDSYDPLNVSNTPGRGLINVIDLSNLSSCSFLATQDVGEFYEDGSFKVLGRSDYSDVRGCNLMVDLSFNP